MILTQPTSTDIFSGRLAHSGNPLEKRSLYMGRNYDLGIPVLLDTDLLVEAQWLQFALELGSMHQVVVRLQAVKAYQVAHVTDPQRFSEQPGRVVGAAYIAHQAAAH